MKTHSYIQLQLWSLVVLTYGCTVLAPVTDRSRFYVLASNSVATTTSAPDPPGDPAPSIGVGPVHMPQYLQRTGIATRVGPTRIEYSHDDHWAEPLNECFPRVLSEDLAQALGTDRIVLFPWNRSLNIPYQLEVTIDRFDIDSNNQAVLMARWLIKDAKSRQILDAGYSSQTRQAGTDGASRTDALSQTLSALSTELAAKLRHLPARTSATRA